MNDLLKKNFDRGKLQLTVRLEMKKTKAVGSPAQIAARFAELKKACKSLGVNFSPDARLVNELIQETSNIGWDAAAFKKIEKSATAAAELAVKNCQRSQAREGARLKKDFLARTKTLETLRAQAAELASNTVALQRERLMKNLAQSGLSIDAQDERLLKELAIFADRVDVAEELTRLESHFTAMRKLIESSGSTGRQLEFLLQELLREWNTLGNKSPRIELVQLALAAKNEVERMKEQAANVS